MLVKLTPELCDESKVKWHLRDCTPLTQIVVFGLNNSSIAIILDHVRQV
jgi:hypothetical protein